MKGAGDHAWRSLFCFCESVISLMPLCLGETDRKLGRKLGLQSHQTTLATEVDLPER